MGDADTGVSHRTFNVAAWINRPNPRCLGTPDQRPVTRTIEDRHDQNIGGNPPVAAALEAMTAAQVLAYVDRVLANAKRPEGDARA